MAQAVCSPLVIWQQELSAGLPRGLGCEWLRRREEKESQKGAKRQRANLHSHRRNCSRLWPPNKLPGEAVRNSAEREIVESVWPMLRHITIDPFSNYMEKGRPMPAPH